MSDGADAPCRRHRECAGRLVAPTAEQNRRSPAFCDAPCLVQPTDKECSPLSRFPGVAVQIAQGADPARIPLQEESRVVETGGPACVSHGRGPLLGVRHKKLQQAKVWEW